MNALTSIERMHRFLRRQPHDRIPVYEHFWEDTKKGWIERGQISEDVNLYHHFDFDMTEQWPFDLTADLDFKPVIVEETEDTIVSIDGNGARLRRHKRHDTTPEHLGFAITDMKSWLEYKEKIAAEDRRINFKAYREEKQWAKENNKFFCWSGLNVFESMHPVCGHENLLVGTALEPEWVLDMAETYSELTINLMEMLFSKEGPPDGIWFYEDMGFKEHSFISLQMYEQLIKPFHKKTIDYAHSLGLPVIMHSCGFVENLLPGMIDAGIDCLQVIEVKAGMDLHRLYKNFGDKLSFMGGIDVREIYSNSRERIDRELTGILPEVMGNNGYALHSDHSIPYTVDYDMFLYYLKRGLELGVYK